MFAFNETGFIERGGAFLSPLVIEGGLHGVGKGVIWIPHYPAAAPTWVAACPVAPKKDSLLCKEVILCGCVQGTLIGRLIQSDY